MSSNSEHPIHGTSAISGGNLTGTTDTDYFYFFCPKCRDRQILRILDYAVRLESPGGEHYPDEKPRQARDFVFTLKLYCPKCKLKDLVKIGNVGWQGGRLPPN